ncbi:hypothetical protein CFOL_v3_34057 [Cephalotus follicularis]|uniref:DUF4283 domain-containing protein n=1 Tax=Cephalotus follicularis TaxID=3775 RepID=A0A1Q3DDU8_CEPFO|nr:hypothetical protein CFOL_v3_34057 [Cephalotus follicularis]
MRLPGLPLPLHNPSFLKAIGDSLGRFLRSDDFTLKLKNPRVARLCVEMDLSAPLPPAFAVAIGELKVHQRIIYESRIPFCTRCRLQGHSDISCRNKKRKLPSVESVPSAPSGKAPSGGLLPAGTPSPGPNNFLPTMLVASSPNCPPPVCDIAQVISPISFQPSFGANSGPSSPLVVPAQAHFPPDPLVGQAPISPSLSPLASPPPLDPSASTSCAQAHPVSMTAGPPLTPLVGSGMPPFNSAYSDPPAPTNVPSLHPGVPLVPSFGQAQSAPLLGPSQAMVPLASAPSLLGPCPPIHVLTPSSPFFGHLPLGPSVFGSVSLLDHPPVSLTYSAPSDSFEHCLSSCPLPPLSSFDPMSLEQSLPPVWRPPLDLHPYVPPLTFRPPSPPINNPYVSEPPSSSNSSSPLVPSSLLVVSNPSESSSPLNPLVSDFSSGSESNSPHFCADPLAYSSPQALAPLQGHASPPSPDIPLDSESPFSSDFNTLNYCAPSSVSPCPSASSSSRVPSKPRDLASTIELSGGTILTLPKYASSPIRVSNPDGSPSSLPTYESPPTVYPYSASLSSPLPVCILNRADGFGSEPSFSDPRWLSPPRFPKQSKKPSRPRRHKSHYVDDLVPEGPE